MASYINLLLVIFQLYSAKTAKIHGPQDAIIFPGSTSQSLGSRQGSGADDVTPVVPPECLHKTFCTVKPKNYPEETFDRMFKNKKIAPPPTLVEENVGNRFWDDEDNCKSEVTYEPIYILKTKSGWRTVVQAPKQNYEQKVRMETCVKPEAPCFKAFASIPDYTSFCKQKYNTWEILVAKEGGGTELIKSELPVCCSCFYRPVDLKKA